VKIFIDTAHVEDIKKVAEYGFVDGVTTNPTLVAKEVKPHRQVIQEIAKVVKGPISVEGNCIDCDDLVKEAEEFAKWAPNVVVKIPMTKEGIKAVRILAKKGIKTNVTLVFSANQALIAAKAGASFVSPFIGRLDDIGEVGMDLVRDIMEIYANYEFKTEVIVASIRNPVHVIEAAKCGAHIATIPANVFELMWNHPLTDIGIEKFRKDYEKTAKT